MTNVNASVSNAVAGAAPNKVADRIYRITISTRVPTNLQDTIERRVLDVENLTMAEYIRLLLVTDLVRRGIFTETQIIKMLA